MGKALVLFSQWLLHCAPSPQSGHQSYSQVLPCSWVCCMSRKGPCSCLGRQDIPAHLAFLILLWAEKWFLFLIVTIQQKSISHSSNSTRIATLPGQTARQCVSTGFESDVWRPWSSSGPEHPLVSQAPHRLSKEEIVGNYIGHFCFLWWKLQGLSGVCPVWDQCSGCRSALCRCLKPAEDRRRGGLF